MSQSRIRITSIRKAVFDRDHGLCALCQLDTEALRRELTDLPTEEREARERKLHWPKHRLDYWDADHVQAVAEDGPTVLTNLRTLCLACHRKVTAELMARRGRPMRAYRVQRAERRRGEHAVPGTDGNWWMATDGQVIQCPQCGRETVDYPAVMKYRAEFDHGGCQAREHPWWKINGWLVWRQCEHCSWMSFHDEAITLETIRRWDIGPWVHTAG